MNSITLWHRLRGHKVTWKWWDGWSYSAGEWSCSCGKRWIWLAPILTPPAQADGDGDGA